MNGMQPETAVQRLTVARGVPIPETQEQRHWIDEYAKKFTVRHGR